MNLADITVENVQERLLEAGLSHAESLSKARQFARVAEALVQKGAVGSAEAYAHFVPGRIEVLGKHTDYAGGRSIVAAVERGFCMVAVPRADARATVLAVELGESVECELEADLQVPSSGWTNYPLTVMRRLARNFGQLEGVDIAFLSDLPPAAGMSSSSAFMIATYLALAARNELSLRDVYRQAIESDLELAAYLGTIENGQSFGPLAGDRGVGTFGGSEDHTAILCSESGTLGQFAYCPARLEQRIAVPEDCVFVIGFSGVVAEKTGAAQDLYNRAALQVRAIVDVWQRATGGDQVYLADVLRSAPDAAEVLQNALRETAEAAYTSAELEQRLRHFLLEDGQIIDAAAAALCAGDMATFGKQVDLSQGYGASVLENQIDETVGLARFARQEGALAASAFGAGFGGGVWALVEQASAAEFTRAWEVAYAHAYPQAAQSALYFASRPGPAACAL